MALTLETMYPGVNNSPFTALAEELLADADSMTLVDASVLPEGPNICTIGTGFDAELVTYELVDGNVVHGLVRHVNGTTSRVWPVGETVARYYSTVDQDAFIENINILNTGKADLDNPVFTGVPEAPTADLATNTKQIATTAFVNNRIASKANSNAIATEFSNSSNYQVGDYVFHEGLLYRFTSNHSAGEWNASHVTNTNISNDLGLKAPLLNPELDGTPTAPTASSGTNTTQIATTAFVRGELNKEILYYPGQAVSVGTTVNSVILRIPAGTATDSTINANTVVLDCIFAASQNITSDVNWYSYNAGYIEFKGVCQSQTSAYVTLGQKGN